MSLESAENSQLAGVVVCISGDPTFDEDKNQHIREQFTDENVSRWLKYRGGRLVEEVTEATTHLICSREAYRRRKRTRNAKNNFLEPVQNETKRDERTVKAARKLGCHIVTYEWLTDTLQLLDYQKRKAPPELYHPGEPRDDEAISALFRKREKKVRPAKEKASSTAVSGGDDEGAGGSGNDGPEHLATSGEENTQKISEVKEPVKSSDVGDSQVNKIVDGIKRLGNSVDSQSNKPAGELKNGPKAENHEPCIDLSSFSIYRDDSGPYQAEVFKDGRRRVLELYESKSNPKKYLFSIGLYQKPDSSKCNRLFPSKTPGDKDHELERFRSRFWRMSGKRWRQRESNPSNGSSSGSQPRLVPKSTIGSANYKKGSDDIGKFKKESRPAKSLVDPREQRQVDLKTSFKRKSSFSESRPAKELKVTKYSIAGGSADEAKNGKSKTA